MRDVVAETAPTTPERGLHRRRRRRYLHRMDVRRLSGEEAHGHPGVAPSAGAGPPYLFLPAPMLSGRVEPPIWHAHMELGVSMAAALLPRWFIPPCDHLHGSVRSFSLPASRC